MAEACETRTDAILWIVANQLGRRNLTASQRAALALEVEKQLAAEAKKRQRLGKSKLTDPTEQGQARDKAAAMVGASAGYVADAKKIAEDAPTLVDPLKQGKINIPQAKKIAALPPEQQPAALERALKKEPITEGGWIYREGQLVEVQTNKEVEAWAHASVPAL